MPDLRRSGGAIPNTYRDRGTVGYLRPWARVACQHGTRRTMMCTPRDGRSARCQAWHASMEWSRWRAPFWHASFWDRQFAPWWTRRHTVGMTTPARRTLGTLLRRAREAAAVSLADAGAAVQKSQSTVRRIEAGTGGKLNLPSLRALMDLYRLVDPAQRQELEALARAPREPAWWQPHASALHRTFPLFLAYEDASAAIDSWDTDIVPGLLQTERYARAIMQAHVPTLPPDVIDARVRVRMMRQARLRREDAPRVRILMDEGCLRRRVGGPDVMREQLRSLVEGVPPTVTLQVLPFDAGACATVLGSFVVFRTAGSDDVAVCELAEGDLFGPATLYTEIFTALSTAALSIESTAEMVREIIEGVTDRDTYSPVA